jgi:peptidoglycan/xylan/chitin deacetylase (PgdA/CDA1 family)
MGVLLMAAALLGVGLVFWMEPLSVLSVIERLTPNIIYRVRTHRPVVALSFDDGPHPIFTPEVLEILHRHDAKATFFVIGERALRHPEVVSQIKAAGHEVGNHYFRNGPTLGHSDADFVDYLAQTEKAIGIEAGSRRDRGGTEAIPPARRRGVAQATPACPSAWVQVRPWLRVPS